LPAVERADRLICARFRLPWKAGLGHFRASGARAWQKDEAVSKRFLGGLCLLAVAGVPSAAIAQQQRPSRPVDLLPPVQAPQPPVQPGPAAPAPAIVAPAVPPPVIAPAWPKADAQALLVAIETVGKRGLIPEDYEPAALKAAIAAGEDVALNDIATRAFTRLVTDLRDGRTPASARIEWFVRDPDAEAMPNEALIARALATHDVPGVLASVEPAHPDYAALKDALAATPPSNKARIDTIRANLERWRWLPRDLGQRYVYVNVPEYMVRVVGKGKNIATYRAIVGAPRTPTPQLAEMATGMIIHPTWTVPRSIIKESVGALIARSPARARAQGYRWTGSGANLSVVQEYGPGNSLGSMKLDMPNPHAIFLHDTPAKALFNKPVRALSHGCIRTDRATEFAILMSILQAGTDHREAAEIFKRGLNDRIPFTEQVPVFINYFTLASSGDGKLSAFSDIYGRDAPVIASFAQPRVDQKIQTVIEPVKPIEAPGA
jgi:murein L,D-transpeptidase YcbB/YkuD